MTYLLFNGKIRRCEKKFNFLTQDISIDFCKSEDFILCPLYKIIVENKSFCDDIKKCGYQLHRLNSIIRHDTNTYKRIMHFVDDYCLSENNIHCSRWKLIEKGAFAPKALLPDGSFLNPKDFMGDITQ